MTKGYLSIPNELFLSLPDSLSALDIFLYGAIAKKADINGVYEMDINYLCRVCRSSVPTVRRMIKRLNEAGLIALTNYSLSRSGLYKVKTITEAIKGE